MKTPEQELFNTLSKYMKDMASYSYTMDKIIEYIENKNLTNETAKARMIMNDLRTAKNYLEQNKIPLAIDRYKFVKNTLLTIK